MKHKDIPPTDALFGVNKRQGVDEPTLIISEEQQEALKRQSAAPARPAQQQPLQQPASAHTTIIGFEPAPARSAPGIVNTSEPVVGWLVVLSGPGKGMHRPIFNGANTIGRNANQRIPLDFGDESIHGDQQAFLVYDARKRQFQLVPNLGRANLVHLNDQALLTNAELKPRDRITMGHTTVLFVPLCSAEFDWADMPMTKS